MRILACLVFVLVSALAAPPASAQTYASTHPDQYYRAAGYRYLGQSREADAARVFRIAARYGDKTSQFELGRLHWEGRGVARDRARAYAWFDLAAERGYPEFLGLRERVWDSLEATERDAALALGAKLYDEFGDAVAKPRLERLLDRARRSAAAANGPRAWVYLACVGDELCDGTSVAKVGAEQFYAAKHWKPDEYWTWQDSAWLPEPEGVVTVGPLRGEDQARAQ